MALTDEQRAMLQLLLEGAQSYEDIGSLLGIPPDEVRTRARSALREIAGADPDAQVGLSDYLLGQADPIGRADAVRQLQSDPETNATAERLVQALRLLAPKAPLPEIPAPKGGKRAPVPPPPPTASTPSPPPPPGPAPSAAPGPRGPGFASRAAAFLSGLGRGRAGGGNPRVRFLIGLAAALVVVVLIVVLTTGGGDGGSDCQPVDTSAAEQAGVPAITLDAVGEAAQQGCKPSGQVTLIPVPGQTKKGQANPNKIAGFAFQTNAVHLKPTSGNEVYVLWIDDGNGRARALGRDPVDDSGDLKGAAQVTGVDLALLQQGTFKIALASQAQQQQIQQSLESQSKRPTGIIPFVGTSVLEGSGADLLRQLQQMLQQAQQQAQSQGGGAQQGAKGSKG